MKQEQLEIACRLQDCRDMDEIRTVLAGRSDIGEAIESLEQLLERLNQMGVADYCVLDMSIVRGLAYYTGVVYEVFDRKQSLRAVAGGGRYDKLLEIVGGPPVVATGFGMGDVVLGILLAEKGKIPPHVQAGALDFFVIDGEEDTFADVLGLVGALRSRDLAADYSFKRQNLGKQLKEANRRGARKAIIVRKGGKLAVKDLLTGRQGGDMSVAEFLNDPVTEIDPA